MQFFRTEASRPSFHARDNPCVPDGKPGIAPDPKHVLMMGTVCGTILLLNEFDLVCILPEYHPSPCLHLRENGCAHLPCIDTQGQPHIAADAILVS